MSGLNFKEIRSLTAAAVYIDDALTGMAEEFMLQEDRIRSTCEAVIRKEVMKSLAGIPVEELKKSRAGIRTGALEDAGFKNLAQIAEADNAALTQVPGIGEKQLAALRGILAGFRRQIGGRQTVRLSAEDRSYENSELIREISVYRKTRKILKDAEPVRKEFHARLDEILYGITIRSRLRWVFSGRSEKDRTVRSVQRLTALMSSPLCKRADFLCRQYDAILQESVSDALQDFEKNSAEYYVILEKLSPDNFSAAGPEKGIPAELALEIDTQAIDDSCFTGQLRRYQEFGAKYILHQKKVLLGDDMGLGKTVQAVAVMAHLYGAEKGGHFLVICPAGVLVNWCREIVKFSTIPVGLLHGAGLEDAFSAWSRYGGAAVTSYETLGKVVGRIDQKMQLSMLIIDEAHYIKNPDAIRSRNVRRLKEESARILMMTGTPLENKVEEMCSLIDFLRPDMSGKVRSLAAMSRTKEFREILSPVYLRRQRDEVLGELPPVVYKEEWCSMTDADQLAYVQQIEVRNFTGARRVGFLQADIHTSSKAERLYDLCMKAREEGRKVLLYSYFRETIAKTQALLGSACAGVITGSTPAAQRQAVIDRFSESPAAGVLICQIQAGGTGLNIQAASIVIFCEPQIKPSLMHQAVARAWRMGQVRSVQVHFLLCENTVDEAVMQVLEKKQLLFDLYADESTMAQAEETLFDQEWIRAFMEKEHSRYLPAVVE